MAKVLNGVETLPKISVAWVWCTNVTDRQTTYRRTDNDSEREREFTFHSLKRYSVCKCRTYRTAKIILLCHKVLSLVAQPYWCNIEPIFNQSGFWNIAHYVGQVTVVGLLTSCQYQVKCSCNLTSVIGPDVQSHSNVVVILTYLYKKLIRRWDSNVNFL